jgi:hypothetical protein
VRGLATRDPPRRSPGGARAAYFKQAIHEKLIEHKEATLGLDISKSFRGDAPLHEEANGAGARHVLPKPIHFPRLLARVEQTVPQTGWGR